MAANLVLSEIRSLLEKRPRIYGHDVDEWRRYIGHTIKWFEQFPQDVEKLLSGYACIERKKLSDERDGYDEDMAKSSHGWDVLSDEEKVRYKFIEELLQPSTTKDSIGRKDWFSVKVKEDKETEK